MAQRRMFSLKIVDSARFLKMPASSQLLYFHLGLHADDDGIVEAYNILRMAGLAEDDLKILVAKEFIIVLNEDLVSFITDWSEHNLIRPDRKIDSIYKNLLIKIVPDVTVIERRERADKKTMDGQWTDNGRHRLGKVRIGKVSLGEVNMGNTPVKFVPPTELEIKDYCIERNNNIDSEQFFDFYQSKNWMIGKNKMKDWKACIRTWEKSSFQQSKKETKSNNPFLDMLRREQELDQTGNNENSFNF